MPNEHSQYVHYPLMAVVSPLESVAELVHDGDIVAIEGFTALIPFAAGHEIIRQRRRDLTLVRMTPDLVYDQLIGAGCARKLVFSWGGNPGVGSLHRIRDAVEHGWPGPLEIEEHSHAGMANRYVAGASGLPFAVLRGYVGTDLPARTPTPSPVRCPFTGEELAAVAALQPRRHDRARAARRPRGNVQSGGSPACRRRPCSPPTAARHRRGGRRRADAAPGRGRAAALGGRRRRRRPGRRGAVLRPRLLRPRQRRLPAVGQDQPRPRGVRARCRGCVEAETRQ